MTAREALEIMHGSRRIQGWFTGAAAMWFAWIDDIQKSHGIEGDIFEIGVHHGRSAILLGAMARPRREGLGVCDVFADQTSNVSGSGHGHREIFERNLRQRLSASLELKIFAQPSHTLHPDLIGSGHRFFHVDGGHNPEEALADLRLAAASICPKGVIAVDDPFRADWPGVTEALIRFLDDNRDFQAIAVGFNKMILVRRAHARIYLDEFDDAFRRAAYHLNYPWNLKQRSFLGDPLRVFYVPPHIAQRSALTRFENYCYRHDFTQRPLLRPLVSIALRIARKKPFA